MNLNYNFDIMFTIKLYDLLQGKDYPEAGESLYAIIKSKQNECDKIILDMNGVTSLPSMFLNVSIGKYIDEFGIESLKNKISFAKITKLQAQRIKEYIAKK